MRKFFISVAALAIVSIATNAQDEMVYRRSSLHQIYIPSSSKISQATLDKITKLGGTVPASASEDNTPIVLEAWSECEFPAKYNNHEIAIKNITLPTNIVSDDEDENGEKSAEKVDKMQQAIEQAIADNQIAKELVKKWFNYKNGKFDMNLVGERGMYNASEMQAAIAKGEARGLASLADAGEELIGNTFVSFSTVKFVSAEPIALATQLAAKAAASQIPNPIAQTAAMKAADVAYEKMKDGYIVTTKTYLYKLVWDEDTSAKFYNEFWNNSSAFEADKNTFKLEFVGIEKSKSTCFPKKDDKDAKKRAVKKNVEKMYVDLGNHYDVFKPVSPIISDAPVKAQVGTKEGLKGGEKFDVLECRYNAKEGKTIWKTVGVVTVDKKQIWDNENIIAGESENNEAGTVFKGKASVGQLLRQQKQK